MRNTTGEGIRVLAVGEILWDIFDGTEILGGASLNFSANIQRLGGAATLITGVGADDRGYRAIDAMKLLGLSTKAVQIVPGEATGIALVESTPSGETTFHIPRPVAFDRIDTSTSSISAETLRLIEWIYFGTLLQTEPALEDFIAELIYTQPNVRCFYDLNLRTGHWNYALVQRLSHRCHVMKLNLDEAKILSGLAHPSSQTFDLTSFCQQWTSEYDIDTMCVTLGAEGCLIYSSGSVDTHSGFSIEVHDTVGAGDAFAAAFLHGYHSKWLTEDIARFANAAGALVASRPGATPEWTYGDCNHIAQQ
ncbi:PfkB family carbohydrate kinase [Edaphobacter albus]|uniref:PfkB family carbohydrate kinase n=1 Tax=Edaphobacter sp. 4G125 TaxID=2763071 RepID=UPI001645034D|nr:PfkB family carbohydrate kinase [Edaphobacter sp. 4G125]QNI37681.1 hypothetical protein H7846_05165 [Edaphobacter sp. 4G125]